MQSLLDNMRVNKGATGGGSVTCEQMWWPSAGINCQE